MGFHYSADLGDLLYVVNADGTGLRRISANLDTLVQDVDPSWAPDGKTIAFVRFDAKDVSGNPIAGAPIGLIDASGENFRLLSALPGADWSWPAWSPDGKSLAASVHTADRPGSRQIAIMNADGTNVRIAVYVEATMFDQPTWAPDGLRLAFRGQGNVSQLVLVNDDGSGYAPFQPLSGLGRSDPAWRVIP